MSTELIKSEERCVFEALKNSFYPGATDESIAMVINYCKAAKLDPMLKPVHIVPMSVKLPGQKEGDEDKYAWRDVVMPGIGLYRIQAERTGKYLGISEPVFGPIIKKKFDSKEVEFPEWCKVFVKKLVGKRIVEFPAIEYWLENYATASKYTKNPNKMWEKRPFGQLAKCAEAQALRKAFPELGSQPTAEEMEGKCLTVDLTEDENPNKKEAAKQLLIENAKQSTEIILQDLNQHKQPEPVFIEEAKKSGALDQRYLATLNQASTVKQLEIRYQKCASEITDENLSAQLLDVYEQKKEQLNESKQS